MDSKTYTYNDIENLNKKIKKIKSKQKLFDIYNIISKDNPNIMENNNGIFIFFSELSNNILQELDVYLSLTLNIKNGKYKYNNIGNNNNNSHNCNIINDSDSCNHFEEGNNIFIEI